MPNVKLQSGIRIIFGKFGCGKGTLNAILGIMEMHDRVRYEECLRQINELQEKLNRKFTPPPRPHCVHSNFKLKDVDFEELEAYDIEEDKFMIPNNEYDYNLLEPCACVHIEEAQKGKIHSHDWKSFPRPAEMAYSWVRHDDILFTMDVQDLKKLNDSIRENAFEYLRPLYIDNEYNRMNVLRKTTVTVAVFYSYDKALEFKNTNNLELVDEFREYHYNGDIYSCYDSKGKQIEFYEGAKPEKDFCYDTTIRVAEVREKPKVEVQVAW